MGIETDRFGMFWTGTSTPMKCGLGCHGIQLVHHGEIDPERTEVAFECLFCRCTTIVRLPSKRPKPICGEQALKRGGPEDPDADHVNEALSKDALKPLTDA